MLLRHLPFLILLIGQPLEAAKITAVSPSVPTKDLQQIRLTFDSDMIALGRENQGNDVGTLTCKNASLQNGEAIPHTKRWVDTKNWVINFHDPLPPGTSCTLEVSPSFKDLRGESLEGKSELRFSTSGPRVLEMEGQSWSGVLQDQLFVLTLDGPVDAMSCEEHAFFEIQGTADKVGAVVRVGSDREKALARVLGRGLSTGDRKPDFNGAAYAAYLVVQAKRSFPDAAQIAFHWKKGIKSTSGMIVEDEQRFSFKVFDAFRATFECQRLQPESPCIPIGNMSLLFSTPALTETLVGTKLVSSKGQVWTPSFIDVFMKKKPGFLSRIGYWFQDLYFKLKSWMSGEVFVRADEDTTSYLNFDAPFADRETYTVFLPSGVQDEYGRSLVNASSFPLQVSTDAYSPLVKFAAHFGILEAEIKADLPVTLRNVENKIDMTKLHIGVDMFEKDLKGTARKIVELYEKIERKQSSYQTDRGEPLLTEGAKSELQKPNPENRSEVLGIPLDGKGFHVVELKSQRLGEKLIGNMPMYVASGALVTNLAAHLKIGGENSMVWVTQLSNAEPVANAKVYVFSKSELDIVAQGRTDKQGIFRVNKALQQRCPAGKHGLRDLCTYVAFAVKGDDITFVSNRWNRGIEGYRFGFSSYGYGTTSRAITAHTIIDRSLARPGDKVRMKHVLRRPSAHGFSPVPKIELPQKTIIKHLGSGKTYVLPTKFEASTGVAMNEFELPKDAALGSYT